MSIRLSYCSFLIMLINLILFCLINSTFCLVCIYSKTKSFDLNSFNEVDFMNTLESFGNRSTIKKKCHVSLFINYTKNSFSVEFPRNSPTIGGVTEIQTTFSHIDRPLKDQNVIMSVGYTCIDNDECNRHYVFKHFSAMIEMNYNETQQSLFDLLSIKLNETFLCYRNPPVVSKCPEGICIAIEKGQGKLEGRCGSQGNKITKVNIIVRIKDDQQQKLINYACNFPQCNNEDRFGKVKNTVESYHQKLSELLEPLKFTTHSITRNRYTLTTIREAVINNDTFKLNISLIFVMFTLLILVEFIFNIQ